MIDVAVLYGILGALINGLRVGSLYGLMALGLTLIYRVTSIPNFAYAEYITYGAYAAYIAMTALALKGTLGLAFALAVALAVATLP